MFFISNDKVEGLRGVGIEGWHVDGNIIDNPHMFTILYSLSANKIGATLMAPLREIVDMLSE